MIDGAKLAFLESVLGVGGAAALSKAAARAPQIENVLLPRTIISWLTVAGQIEYNGSIPGIDQSRMSLTKTDSGWDGSIEISGSEYQLNGADLCKVGAHIAVAIGADEDIDPSVKTVDIAKLGKTIDLLIKARAVQGLAKGWPKDEKENQENLEAHAVLQDMAEEKGKVVGEPKRGNWRSGAAIWTQTGQLGDFFEEAAPNEWLWRVNPIHAVLGRNIEGTNYAVSGIGGHQGIKEGRPLFTPGATWKVQVEERIPLGDNSVGYRYPKTFVANSHHHVRAIGDALAQHLQSGKTLESFNADGIPAPQPVSDEYEAKFGTKKAEASGRGAHERAGTPETLKPDGPIPQAGPTKQQGIPKQNMPRPTGHNPSGPTAKSERSAKISKAQSQRKCHICGHTHFSGGHFTGCKCLTNLAKNISSVSDNKGGFVVTMQSLSLEDIVFVLDTLRGE